jgi:hypothetical protein
MLKSRTKIPPYRTEYFKTGKENAAKKPDLSHQAFLKTLAI